MTGDQHHEQRSQRGYRRKGSKEVVKTRLATMDAAEAKRKPVGCDDMDASETVGAKRDREMDSETTAQSLRKECRVGNLHLAFTANKEGECPMAAS